MFERAVHELNLDDLLPVLYTARHSGASNDRSTGRISLQEVQRRGRWRQPSSVRRYEKRGLIQAVWSQMEQGQVLLPQGRGRAALAARRRLAIRQRLSDPRAKRDEFFFIEIFSGSEHFSNSLRRRGFRVYSFDVLQGPSGDLLRPAVLKRILRMLRSDKCLGLLAGVPCKSFSIARGGHNAVRSSQAPSGLPSLPPHLQSLVDEGNKLFQVSIKIFRCCKQMRVPFLWENPQSSYMWKMEAAVQVFRWPGVCDIITNYCGWGTPWSQPTRFRCFLLPRADELSKRCRPVHGICSFTG